MCHRRLVAAFNARDHQMNYLYSNFGVPTLGLKRGLGQNAVIEQVVASLAAAADLSVILRRGLSAKQRIARHLWRTHVGLFAAVGSFFPGQLQFFPEFIQQVRPIILLFIPSFLIIGLMLFWLVRLFFTGWFAKKPVMATASPTPSA